MAAIVEVCVPDIGDFEDIPVIELLVKPGDSVVTLSSTAAFKAGVPDFVGYGRCGSALALPLHLDISSQMGAWQLRRCRLLRELATAAIAQMLSNSSRAERVIANPSLDPVANARRRII